MLSRPRRVAVRGPRRAWPDAVTADAPVTARGLGDATRPSSTPESLSVGSYTRETKTCRVRCVRCTRMRITEWVGGPWRGRRRGQSAARPASRSSPAPGAAAAAWAYAGPAVCEAGTRRGGPRPGTRVAAGPAPREVGPTAPRLWAAHAGTATRVDARAPAAACTHRASAHTCPPAWPYHSAQVITHAYSTPREGHHKQTVATPPTPSRTEARGDEEWKPNATQGRIPHATLASPSCARSHDMLWPTAAHTPHSRAHAHCAQTTTEFRHRAEAFAMPTATQTFRTRWSQPICTLAAVQPWQPSHRVASRPTLLVAQVVTVAARVAMGRHSSTDCMATAAAAGVAAARPQTQSLIHALD